jgi:hypothetical protein
MIARRILTPTELCDLLLARNPPPAHDLVHWTDAQGREHTVLYGAYWDVLVGDYTAEFNKLFG